MFGCYFISALLLPLLTHFGLADFTGVLISKLFIKAFNLPGRAAIDALTSWVSASSVGVIMTASQYRNGGYSKREAAIVATNFSIVSITFAYVILKFVHMESHFIAWYGCVLTCGIVCAIIISRLPPLRLIDNTLITGELKNPDDNHIDYQDSLLRTAAEHGMKRAEKAGSIQTMLIDALYFVIDTTITVIPAMMVFGGLGLSLIEFTGILNIVSTPLVPYLELLGIPEASAAAAAICSGFIDILMPVILGSSIESEVARFVIAGVAVNQLVFMNEIAVLMLKAKIGLSIPKIAALWLLRVLISIPLMALCAHMLF
ncbi:YjiH family protein [Vibrio celticus]|uniref:Nucleoside recognition n=1 Tax=Vibrio celticus TaxID=446372 RepID=A0A1C3JKB1_9VIBR|nr:nucleoside recognition domain-containing protein [Vibrio celticus]SBT15610.1 Nucleoside recognition [Vibrio celticus]